MLSALSLAKHRAGDAYRNAVSAVSASPTESKFLENGTLTPDEFVQAGDQLSFKFPTWRWEHGDKDCFVSCLPVEKQYLVTRSVPCRRRVSALDYALEHDTREEDDWLVPEADRPSEISAGGLRDIDDLDLAADAAPAAGFAGFATTEDFISAPGPAGGDLPDFSDLDACLTEEDPACAAGGPLLVADAPDEHIEQSRTYDIMITYDRYYQSPRLWLQGYDEGCQPLTQGQIIEDLADEYIKKTATFDRFPHGSLYLLAIHPCKHSQVMKKVIDGWVAKGICPRPDLALIPFLKFMASVMPTINYDFTMDIETF